MGCVYYRWQLVFAVILNNNVLWLILFALYMYVMLDTVVDIT